MLLLLLLLLFKPGQFYKIDFSYPYQYGQPIYLFMSNFNFITMKHTCRAERSQNSKRKTGLQRR